jgi:hypothetical protein
MMTWATLEEAATMAAAAMTRRREWTDFFISSSGYVGTEWLRFYFNGAGGKIRRPGLVKISKVLAGPLNADGSGQAA